MAALGLLSCAGWSIPLQCSHTLSLPVKPGTLSWLQPHRCSKSAEAVPPSVQGAAMRWPSSTHSACKHPSSCADTHHIVMTSMPPALLACSLRETLQSHLLVQHANLGMHRLALTVRCPC